jgi:hypothetical protein
VDYPVSPDVTMKYDSLSRMTNMVTAGLFTNHYTYTAWGALAGEDGPWADDTVSYAYTQRQRTGLNLLQPSAADWAVSYGWDATKRLTHVTSGAGAFSYAFRAEQPTVVSRLGLPYGHYVTNSYDALARLTGTSLSTARGRSSMRTPTS